MDDGESYRVTVSASDPTQLASGVLADVAIVTAATEGAVAVLDIGRHHHRWDSTVTVLEDGQAVPQSVQVGTVGPTRTEILGGIEEGTELVLADLTAPLPTSATAAAVTGGGVGGGQSTFPGGGRGGFAPPGGFGGGQRATRMISHRDECPAFSGAFQGVLRSCSGVGHTIVVLTPTSTRSIP